ncbi:MAG: hypothetical protein Q9M09_01470 [Mariprofundaceae bacterium]|nr:hypothetical protein [Mariprofundaceae bacterium]
MASIKEKIIIVVLLISGMLLHVQGKNSGTLQEQDENTLFLTGPSSLLVQQAIAGPCLGLGAESNILSVFSVYWSIKEKNLSEDDQQKAWLYLYRYLQQAQSFDPWYWDTYRLTNGLLAYQESYQSKAVDILAQGAKARSWDWEMPFTAGFLAHDQLKDDVRAFHLMKLAINREGAPPMLVGLAARFLNKTATESDTVDFLRAMKKSLPKGYTQYIDKRIDELLHGGF